MKHKLQNSKSYSKKVKNDEKKIKWFLIWPIIDLHEWYEEYKKDKNGDIKT